jgi:hypothetical protein
MRRSGRPFSTASANPWRTSPQKSKCSLSPESRSNGRPLDGALTALEDGGGYEPYTSRNHGGPRRARQDLRRPGPSQNRTRGHSFARSRRTAHDFNLGNLHRSIALIHNHDAKAVSHFARAAPVISQSKPRTIATVVQNRDSRGDQAHCKASEGEPTGNPVWIHLAIMSHAGARCSCVKQQAESGPRRREEGKDSLPGRVGCLGPGARTSTRCRDRITSSRRQ